MFFSTTKTYDNTILILAVEQKKKRRRRPNDNIFLRCTSITRNLDLQVQMEFIFARPIIAHAEYKMAATVT